MLTSSHPLHMPTEIHCEEDLSELAVFAINSIYYLLTSVKLCIHLSQDKHRGLGIGGFKYDIIFKRFFQEDSF